MAYRNPLIDFLKAYGPSEAANNLFDEHVTNAAARYGVEPFHVHNDLIDAIEDNFRSHNPKSVVLTGTAGDGKTYLCRKLYERLGGSAEDFREAGEIKRMRTPGGKKLTIIKDLSELREVDKEQELSVIARAFTGGEPDRVFLFAANDGQLLKFWRDYVDNHSHAAQVFDGIRWMLKEERPDHEDLPGLRLENLSRQPNAALFDKVIDAVLDHPGWQQCDGCPVAHAPPRCPILENRDRLWGQDDATFRRRLKDAITLASANDRHLPMRQLFLLVSNILLGDSVNHDLLTCNKAQIRARNGQYAAVNPYDNALGLNLRLSYQGIYAAFTTLASFGIGQETNKTIDTLLLEAQPEAWHQAYIANDPLYGAPLLEDERCTYRRGSSDQYDSLLRAMESQRRRLFFTLPEDTPSHQLEPWQLTVLHNGTKYLELQSTLNNNAEDPAIVREIVKGLNRIFTGTMAEESNSLWFAMPPGNVNVRAGRVMEHRAIKILRGQTGMPFVTVDNGGVNHRPRLVLMHKKDAEPLAVIELKPLLFEYIVRVAQGSLPTSFSRECFEEIKYFRLKAVAALTDLNGDEPMDSDLELVTLDLNTGRLNASPLTVEDTP